MSAKRRRKVRSRRSAKQLMHMYGEILFWGIALIIAIWTGRTAYGKVKEFFDVKTVDLSDSD